MNRLRRHNGYILLPVIVVITLVAAIALLMNTESALESNTAATELEAQQAQYVAEAGMNHALWLARQQGCGAYSDLTSVSLGNDQYTTNLTTDLGSTTAFTISVDQDTWIRSDQPTTNKAADINLHLRNEAAGIERILLRYDLSPIAANASILSATAWFYVTASHPEGPFDIHLTSADWIETDATWDSMNANMDAGVLATVPGQSATGVWIAVNLTAQAQAWVNGAANYGITLNSTVDGVHGQYQSRESGHPPYLEVVVGAPPSSPALLKAVGTLANGVTRDITRNDVTLVQHPAGNVFLQLGSDAGEDAMLDSFYNLRNYGGANYMQVHDNESDWQQYPLIRFNLNRLPQAAVVHSARLELRLLNLNAPGKAMIHQVTRDWVEGTKSGGGVADGASWDTYDGTNPWASAGGDVNTMVVAETAINGGETWVSWDIASLVERWLSGDSNYGLLIKPDSALNEARFASKEDADQALHPKLSITYACACGEVCVAPQGSGNVLLVVDSTTSPDPEDLFKQSLMESLGYTVTMIADGQSQSAFDTAMAANDVIYVSETIDATTLGSKLGNPDIGIVNEEGWKNDDFGFESANSSNWPVGDSITITDTSHYITQPFASGSLKIYFADMGGLAIDNTPAPDLQSLADWGADSGLAILETGAMTSFGSPAAGRRVMLPFGRDINMDWPSVNNNGRLIMQRALQWGTGNTGELPNLIYRDEFTNRNCDAADYTGSDGALDWSPWTWTEGGDDGDSCGSGSDAIYLLEDPVVIEPGNNRLVLSGNLKSIARQADLSAFTIAYLSFEYRRHLMNSNDIVTVEIWDDGVGVWVPLGQISGLADDATYQSVSYDISAYISANASIRFSTAGMGQLNNLFIDNVQISETAGTGCGSSQPLLLVVGDATTLSSKDDGMKTLMESWCYVVTLIDDGDSQANFDAAAAAGGVVYVSGTTSGPSLQDKLTGSPTPIVNEINGKLDNFGFSSSTASSVTASAFSVTSASHYISEPFAGNPVTFFTTDLAMPVPGGTLAPDLQIVGETTGAIPALVTLDAGAQRWDGTPAPARRVHLPFTNAETSQLTADGETLMKRSIEWAGGANIDLPPVAHWKLNDGSGFTAIDSVGGNDATLNGNPDWTTGVADGALEFDGSGDYATTDNNFTPPPVGTVSFWMKVPGSPASHGRILGLDDTWEIRHVTTGTPDGIPYGLVFDLGVTGVNTEFVTTITVDTPDQWYFVAATYDTNNDAYAVYLDGVLHKSGTYPSALAVPAANPLSLGTRTGSSNYFDGTLDDVRIYDYALSASAIADLYAANPPPVAASYTELYQEWSATSDDTWQTVDLGAYGVPANAVVEVAVTNNKIGNQRWGGVRAVGSSLDRRFQLHEAEDGGLDVVTMHVQTDASSQIQHYSDRKAEVRFTLLGYWVGPSYVELFETFSADSPNSWVSEDVSDDGLGPNQVAEVVIVNTNTSNERLAGIRATGSTPQRRFDIHEADSGGVDVVSMMVNTDASSQIEVYAESTGDIDFYVVGYWSTAPGTYAETGGSHGQVTAAATWEPTDLTSFGVPADTVAQFVISNENNSAENNMGVRNIGSLLVRLLDLHEAKDGGSDNATLHVNVNGSSQVEWYAESGGAERFFYPVGWWVLSP